MIVGSREELSERRRGGDAYGSDGVSFIAGSDESEGSSGSGSSSAGMTPCFYAAVDRKAALRREREARAPGLGVALAFRGRAHTLANAMDQYLRFLAAALVAPRAAAAALSMRHCADARLWAQVAKQTEGKLRAATRSLAQSQSWAQRKAKGGLSLALGALPHIVARELPPDAFPRGSGPTARRAAAAITPRATL